MLILLSNIYSNWGPVRPQLVLQLINVLSQIAFGYMLCFFIMRMPQVRAIKSIGESGLVVCDEFFTVVLIGDGAQSFSQVEFSNRYGCKSYKSMVSFGNFMLMMSDVGIVGVSNAGMELLSLAVDDIISGMSDTTKKATRAFRYEDWYILCYDSDGDTINDAALMYDTKFGVWVKFTNQKFSGGAVVADGSVLVGSDVADGKLYTWWSGTTDAGTAITMTAETKGWDFGRWFARKQLRQVYFQTVKPGTSYNLTARPLVDGTVAGSNQTIDVNNGQDDMMFEDSVWGYVQQLRLTNSGSADVIEVRSLVGVVEMSPAGEIV